jgi:hypothetical protein
MDSSFLQSQHPVVEELLTNKYFGDTLLVCANGHLTDNKVGLRTVSEAAEALITSGLYFEVSFWHPHIRGSTLILSFKKIFMLLNH